jgi:hypothetical protein
MPAAATRRDGVGTTVKSEAGALLERDADRVTDRQHGGGRVVECDEGAVIARWQQADLPLASSTTLVDDRAPAPLGAEEVGDP